MKKQKLTHGEAWANKKLNLDLKQDTLYICRQFERLPRKMDRQKAAQYYNEKLRLYFGVEEVTPKSFAKVEHYFDYYEALRLKRKLM